MAVTVRELERIRREGLKALKDKLGVEGMIKFIQMYSDGKGDYTKEKYENNEELITIEDGYLDIGLNDTMEDLWVNFIGASIYSILGYFYIKNRDKYSLASKFIITKQK